MSRAGLPEDLSGTVDRRALSQDEHVVDNFVVDQDGR